MPADGTGPSPAGGDPRPHARVAGGLLLLVALALAACTGSTGSGRAAEDTRTLTLATAVRNAINAGVPWPDAVRAATLNPARYLGLPGVGELVTGAWADAVAFDSDWRPVAVVKRGVLV